MCFKHVTCHYVEQWWLSLFTHNCYEWWYAGYAIGSYFLQQILLIHDWSWQVNSLWPSDTIWRQRSGSTLAQVMACCLMAASHYQNQCWLFIFKSSDIHIMAISQEMPQTSITKNPFENYISKILLKFHRGNELNLWSRTCEMVSVPVT